MMSASSVDDSWTQVCLMLWKGELLLLALGAITPGYVIAKLIKSVAGQLAAIYLAQPMIIALPGFQHMWRPPKELRLNANNNRYRRRSVVTPRQDR